MDGGTLGPWRPTVVDSGNDDSYAEALPNGLLNLRLDAWPAPAPTALMAHAAALFARQARVLPSHPHDPGDPGR